MTTSSRAGLALLKHFEGCRLQAYPDPATGGAPWTIGYGRTTNVHRGDTCSQAQADTWVEQEYDGFKVRVRALVHVHLNENQLGALVCFAYNVGVANLASSTLLRLVNAGRFGEVPAQFLRWNKAAGKVMAGLTIRRAAEGALFARA